MREPIDAGALARTVMETIAPVAAANGVVCDLIVEPGVRAFESDTLRVKAGTTVRWINQDPIVHNVTSVSGPQHLSSGALAQGRTYSVTLARPGTIHYECTIHPATMNGTIEVLR